MRSYKKTKYSLREYDVVDAGYPEDAGFCAACSNLPATSISHSPSYADILGDEVTEDDFQREVAGKTRILNIGRREAEREVVVDRLIHKCGDKEKALLFVLTEFPTELKVQIFTNMLLQRGANPSTCDPQWQTPLHHAVRRGFKGVCGKLLENDALPHVRDKDNNMPYHIALNNNNDDIAAMILAHMPNKVVRDLYIAGTSSEKSECSFNKLLKTNMQHTALGVLDCMIDPIGDTGHVTVYYHVLEADDNGRTPHHPYFDHNSKCCLHLIAKGRLKDVVFHDSVRLLIRRKWKKYVRFRFLVNSMIFCLTQLCMTFALAVATLTPDPTSYSGSLQVARAVTEVWTCGAVFLSFLLELNQMRRQRLGYWKERFNWIDLTSSCLLLAVVALRFTHRQEQWHVFSVGYLIWTLKIFKYASVFRQTGAYALILVRILAHDFVQFAIFFSVILLAFSGSFVLALRGENSLEVHEDTGTFWHTLFTGIRILIEADPVVEYYGTNGYRPLSCILMVVFLIMCCVVLLNILIAQLSDTYQNVQEDAQRGLELNRAWIISRVEQNSILLGKQNRIKRYCEYEMVHNTKEVLDRWESPPLSDLNKHIRAMSEQQETTQFSMLALENRLVRQEQALTKMQNLLEELVSNHRQMGSRSSLDDAALGSRETLTLHEGISTCGTYQNNSQENISTCCGSNMPVCRKDLKINQDQHVCMSNIEIQNRQPPTQDNSTPQQNTTTAEQNKSEAVLTNTKPDFGVSNSESEVSSECIPSIRTEINVVKSENYKTKPTERDDVSTDFFGTKDELKFGNDTDNSVNSNHEQLVKFDDGSVMFDEDNLIRGKKQNIQTESDEQDIVHYEQNTCRILNEQTTSTVSHVQNDVSEESAIEMSDEDGVQSDSIVVRL